MESVAKPVATSGDATERYIEEALVSTSERELKPGFQDKLGLG
jgi:hypothetical protein